MAEKIDNLVSQMTLEEKASMTSGRDAWSTQPIERLDIPYIWMADGIHSNPVTKQGATCLFSSWVDS